MAAAFPGWLQPAPHLGVGPEPVGDSHWFRPIVVGHWYRVSADWEPASAPRPLAPMPGPHNNDRVGPLTFGNLVSVLFQRWLVSGLANAAVK